MRRDPRNPEAAERPGTAEGRGVTVNPTPSPDIVEQARQWVRSYRWWIDRGHSTIVETDGRPLVALIDALAEELAIARRQLDEGAR